MNAQSAFDPAAHPRSSKGRFAVADRAASGLALDPDTTSTSVTAGSVTRGAVLSEEDARTLPQVDLTFHAGDLPEPAGNEFTSRHLPYDADPLSPSLVNYDQLDPQTDTVPAEVQVAEVHPLRGSDRARAPRDDRQGRVA